MKVKVVLSVVLLGLMIHGCARRTVRNTHDIPPHPGQSKIYRLPDSEGVVGRSKQMPRRIPKQPESVTPPPVKSSPAVIALLKQSDDEWSEGNVRQAVVIIERAIRIQPRNPLPWHRLAVLRLQQGRYELAENMARKSSFLARSDKSLIEKNRKIIRKARRRKIR